MEGTGGFSSAAKTFVHGVIGRAARSERRLCRNLRNGKPPDQNTQILEQSMAEPVPIRPPPSSGITIRVVQAIHLATFIPSVGLCDSRLRAPSRVAQTDRDHTASRSILSPSPTQLQL